MKHLVEFPLEDGNSVFIEVESDETEGMTPASPLSDVPRKAQQTFEAALDSVRSVASVIVQKVQSLPKSPDEVEVEFSVKMDAAAGAIISTAGVEANFKITLTWKKATPPTQAAPLSSAP